MSFAVIKTGGKQYIVAPDKTIKIEKIEGKVGDKVKLDEVLLVYDGKEVKIGTPLIKGANVCAKILEQGRDRKKIVFRYHSKTRYRKKKGHRQAYTKIKITNIKI